MRSSLSEQIYAWFSNVKFCEGGSVPDACVCEDKTVTVHPPPLWPAAHGACARKLVHRHGRTGKGRFPRSGRAGKRRPPAFSWHVGTPGSSGRSWPAPDRVCLQPVDSLDTGGYLWKAMLTPTAQEEQRSGNSVHNWASANIPVQWAGAIV